MGAPDALKIYQLLINHYGPQGWWPGETPLEVIVGAVLTQNTAWKNVEKAIRNLKEAGLMDLHRLVDVDEGLLAGLIRPSGYFNIKTKRLKAVIRFFESHGGLEEFQEWDTTRLRKGLLEVRGVGEETADSILLYAFGRPVFVVDAYTKRIFHRLGLIDENPDYRAVQDYFETTLTPSTKLYNEYHALIVRLGKEVCRKNRPLCRECPLKALCPSDGQSLIP